VTPRRQGRPPAGLYSLPINPQGSGQRLQQSIDLLYVLLEGANLGSGSEPDRGQTLGDQAFGIREGLREAKQDEFGAQRDVDPELAKKPANTVEAGRAGGDPAGADAVG
jgi:hypothetical protein